MSNAEQLRLEASMRDNASPVVRKLKKELDAIRQTPGMAEATKWFGQFEEGAKGFVKSGGDAAGVVNALGIGGLTAAASVATLITQFKELGERTLAIKELGRQTGLTTDQVNAFGRAGQSFGVGTDVMQGALNRLASQMPEFRRNMGPLYQLLSGVKGAGGLIAQLQHDGPEKQIEDIFKFLGQQKLQSEPQLQKQILGAFFGSGDQMEALFARGATGFLDELKKQQGSLGPITDDLLKQAQAYRDATIDFNTALTNFETGAGPAFLKQMSDLLKGAKEFVDVLGKGGNDKGADKTPDHQDHRSWGQALGDAANDAGKALGKTWDWLSKATADDPAKLRHKSSFDGSQSLLHRASFVTGAPADVSGSGLVGVIADGTKAGFLAAMRELMATQDLSKADGAPGLIKASWGDAGGGGVGAGTGGGRNLSGAGGGLGPGTAIDKTLPKEARALLDAIAAGEAKDYNVLNGGGTFGDYSHHPGGRAAGRYQDLPSTWRRISGALGLKDFSPESQDKGNWWLAQQDYRSRTGRNLLGDLRSGDPNTIAQIGRALHSTWVSTNGAFAGRYAGALGRSAALADNAGASVPGHIGGHLKIEGETYRFGSGGVRGSASIPFGDYPITPGSIGAWGQSHGALGINGNAIYDKALGRMRRGIELHAGHSADLITEGCVAFERAQFPKLKAHVLDLIHRHGQAYLHVGRDGASITPRRATGLADAQVARNAAGGSRHKLDIHLHDRGGAVRSTAHRGEGPMEVKLRTWPTMTEPSWET